MLAQPIPVRHAETTPRRVVTIGGVRVRAQIDPGLSLPERAADNLELVGRVLTAAGIDFWRVPTNLARPVLGVREADQLAVCAALADPALTGWYRDRLTTRNQQLLRLEPPRAALPPSTPGIVVWPYVVADPRSAFMAGPTQGVSITFWRLLPELGLEPAGGADDELTGEPAEDPSGTPAEGPTGGAEAPPVWSCPVRNGALETIAEADVVGLRGEVPAAAGVRHLARVDFDVDVVYTWVDGSDPGWLAGKLAAAGEPIDQQRTERAADDVRFADHDELRHSLRSVEQFAPWVRHIWVVTGGQRPAWLADHPRITVVDHRDIWPDAIGLPTFNSHAIEACLHRIPGLSEHFLYFNDDMILGRPVRPERFFHGNGMTQFFWSNALVDYLPVQDGEVASSVAAKNARRLLAADFGITFSRKFFHAPYPLRVSVLQELEERFPSEFAATRAARFRSTADIAAAGSLYFNYAYATGRSAPGRISYAYVDPAAPSGPAVLSRLLRRRGYDTFCINDGHTAQSPQEREAGDVLVRQFLAAYLPVPSAFERTSAFRVV